MSSRKKQSSLDLSDQEVAAREAAGIALDAPLNEQEIEAREIEKQNLLVQVKPVDPPVKATPTSSLIDKFIQKANAPTQDVLATEKAECENVARPMLTEARSIETAFGILRAKYQPLVEPYAGTDWAALRAATPSVLVWSEKAGMLIDISKQAISHFQAAVQNARSALASTFGDAQVTPNETSTVSLQHATQILSNLLDGRDNHVSDKSLDGHSVRVLTQTFRRAVVQMEWWLKKSRMVLEQAQQAVERFVRTERELNEVLAKLEPKDEIAPQPKKEYLPKLEPEKVNEASSYTPFEPRSIMRDEPVASDVVVEKIGDAGFRVTSKGVK